MVREEATARGLPPEREHLIRIGNLLREEGGPGALARRILPRLGQRDVVDSIRSPGEVEVLRGLPSFVLLAVRAPLEVRFGRALVRGRPGDPRTLEEFRSRERQENVDAVWSQQLDATFRLADRVLDNGGDLDRLREAVDRLVDEYPP